MVRIEWANPAVEDFVAIQAFMEKTSTSYAQHFAARVFEVLEKLVEFPEMGRWVPEAGRSDIRELIVLNYRVIYLVQDDKRSVVVLALVHGKRDLAAPDKPPWNNPLP